MVTTVTATGQGLTQPVENIETVKMIMGNISISDYQQIGPDVER